MKQASNISTRQRGAIAIVFGLSLACLVGFVGIALDLARVHNRRAELDAVAKVAALAAASELNGSSDGIDNAAAKAQAAMAGLKYDYDRRDIGWAGQALSFSASPDGGWVDAATARGAPAGLFYARAATGALGASMGTIELFFTHMLSATLTSIDVAATAVAGRTTVEVTPLAVCALSASVAESRANSGGASNAELVQYGFRRGVAYDLMQLNPNGTAAENFVIDPFSPPGVAGVLANLAPALVGPYVCAGQLGMPRVSGGTLTVGRPFPLASLYNQLNSRFDLYNGTLCSYATAPPDTNIRSYVAGTATAWMSAAPAGQAARASSVDGMLRTVADPLPPPAGTTAPMYGPLWAYARAVPYSAYVAGVAEPAGGYATFATTNWSALYGPAAPTATSAYPGGGSTPYRMLIGTNFQQPNTARRGQANRRVLNVPLLSCPVPAGALSSATVLGIGKFLMTVPATATSVYAEFGGLVREQSVAGAVELYP